MSSSTCRPPPPKAFDLDLTIISAKHLKNVNWINGDLKAYAVFWVDPDRRLATKSDDSGSTRPVWNERFTLPLTRPLHESYLTLEIFHSKPSETPKPLVGTLRVGLKEISDPDDTARIRTFELIRPSGRPQGKIRVKLGIRERPLPPPPPQDYPNTPMQPYYYGNVPMRYGTASPPPPPPPTLPHHPYSSYHPDTYNSSPYYQTTYWSVPPHMPPPRPSFERTNSNSSTYGGSVAGAGGGPSAPIDYTYGTAPYDNSNNSKNKGGSLGFGAGLGVGAVAGALGGLAIDEGLKYEEEKIEHEVTGSSTASVTATRDDYSDYHHRVDY